MSILAVITARQGSKRLPGKNIKILGGKPLINWTIEVARDIEDICNLLVSTDSNEIAKIAKAAGAFVPWLRPPELAADNSDSVAVVIHALNWYEREIAKVEGVLLLQPTSPFRTKSSIVRGISEYKRNPNSTIIGVSPCTIEKPIMFTKDEKFLKFAHTSISGAITQAPPDDCYCPNGILYLTSPENLRRNESFFKGDLLPIFSSSEAECLDIDTMEDWLRAEAMLKFGPIGEL